ncbi:MAG: glycosyltransferase [Firmicutes bacterium]|nr:glycosyltransferase [Bacillota bacterium]
MQGNIKTKILWFSNAVLGEQNVIGSGSWLHAMRDLVAHEIELINITNSNVKDIQHFKYENFEEFILPYYKLFNGVPSLSNINYITKIVETVNPDIIHVWGVEQYWGLLFSRGYIDRDYLLEIQGLLGSCYNVYYGGLTITERLKCIGVKELIRPTSLLSIKKKYLYKRSLYEQEILSNARYISTQSDWVRDQISFFAEPIQLYKTKISIRSDFYESAKWNIDNHVQSEYFKVFTTVSYFSPFKGFHILIKALILLKAKYNNIVLYVAGDNILNEIFYRKDGYKKYLTKLINEHRLEANVVFLGRLNAQQIASQLLQSDVFVNTSFVESFSLGAAEALYLGVPSVLSYAGAMPNFSKEKPTALYYSPLDYVDCAAQIDRFLSDEKTALKFSKNAIESMHTSNNLTEIKNTQLRIYKDFQKKCTQL